MTSNKNQSRPIATAQDPSLVRCFRGHEQVVTAVGFSRQMKQVVSGAGDGVVEVWNFKPQIRPFKFVGHKGTVNDVLFTKDSSKVFSCGDDREIKIWKNSVNGTHKSVKAHTGAVLKLSISKDEEFLMSCSSDKTVKMWSIDGKFRQSFTGHTNWVRQCQISTDQRVLLSCSDDKTVKLWDISKATVVNTFNEHRAEVLSCKFTPDGTCVAASAIDGTIKLWDTRLGKLIQHYNAHDGAVNRLCFHPAGYQMASVSNDGFVKIWNLKQGRMGWMVTGHQGQVKTIDFNESGDYFATGAQDKLVMIWMSNFDKTYVSGGRAVESNFKELSHGHGVQPLFKSNKISSEEIKPVTETKSNPEDQAVEHRQSLTVKSKTAQIAAEKLSFELEKIVSQMELVSSALDSMDRELISQQSALDEIYANEDIEQQMEEFTAKGINQRAVYSSAWESWKNTAEPAQTQAFNRGFAEDGESDGQNEISSQPPILEDPDDQIGRFLAEQQAKKEQFKARLDRVAFEFMEDEQN